MKKQNIIKRLHKPVHPKVSYFVLAVSVILIVAGFLTILEQLSLSSSRHTTSTILPTYPPITPKRITVPPPPKIPVQTFTSSDLGISFHYRDITDPSGHTTYPVSVKEVGNKVYIYQGDFNPDQDKYVEVVNKPASKSIDAAIRNQFMQNYQTCIIEVESQPRKYMPATYIRAEATPTDNSANPYQCPGYVFGGVAYFLMDTAHPDKLLFFDLGQDNFGSGIYYGSNSEYEFTWDKTLTFVDTK